MKYASIVPLIGGETIAMQNVFKKKPEYILSYEDFQPNDQKPLWNTTKERYPTIFLMVVGNLLFLTSTLLIPFALVLVFLVSILQPILMLLLTIGCLPLLVTFWAHSNLKYSGAKTRQDLLQEWVSLLEKTSDVLGKKTDILSAYIKRKVSCMDSDK